MASTPALPSDIYDDDHRHQEDTGTNDTANYDRSRFPMVAMRYNFRAFRRVHPHISRGRVWPSIDEVQVGSTGVRD